MKKLWIYVSVVAAFFYVVTPVTAAAEDALKIVYNVGVAPLKFEDADARPAGLFPDLWQMWAKKAGTKIEFVKTATFKESLDLLRAGTVNLHAGLFKTEARQAFLDYSEPILSLEYYIFTHPSIHPISSLEKTSGFIVGIPKSGFTERFVRAKVPANRIVVYDRFQDLFRAALEGEIRVFVATELSLFYYLKENFFTNIFEYDRDRPLFSQVYYSATRKGNPQLIQQVNQGLKAISSEERQQVENRWIVQDFERFSIESTSESSDEEKEKTQITLSEMEKAFLRAHPFIRVHNEKGWPPFNYYEYGSPRGLSIDYMNLLAELLGLKIEYVTGPSWNEFLMMAEAKELDVMLNIVKTEDRMTYLLFTEPYIRNPNVIVSSPENAFEKIDRLSGKIVAFPKGSFYEEVLTRSYPRIKRLPMQDTLASLKAVMFGQADAALGEAAVVKTLIYKNMLSGLRISGEVNIGDLDFTHLRIGVRDDRPLLHSALMKAMAAVTPQQMNRIRQKWIAEDREAPVSEIPDALSYKKIAVYGVAVFFILSLLCWMLIKAVKRELITVNFGSRWFRGLVLAGLSLFVIIVCLLGWFTLEQNKKKILAGVGESLKETLKTADKRLDLWVAQRISSLKLAGSDPELVTITKRLLGIKPSREDLTASDALQDARTYLEKKRKILSNAGFSIINRAHVNIGSLTDTDIGIRNPISVHEPDLLRRAFAGEIVFVPPIESDALSGKAPGTEESGSPSTKLFMGSIRDANEQIIAVMLLRVDLSKALSSILPFSETRTRRTGETYAFNRQGEMLSESRFNDQLRRIGLIGKDQPSAANIAIRDPGVNLVAGQRPERKRSQQPFTRMLSRTLQLKRDMDQAGQSYGRSKIEIDTAGYRDYRGVPVFGAWLWNADLGLGLATEIDVAEALSNYYQMRWTVLGVLGFTLILSVGAVLLVLILGERTSRALQRSQDELEQRVEERTAELRKLSQATENSPASVVVTDKNGIIEYVNPTFSNVTGYSPEEAIGQNPRILKSGDLPESYYKELWDTILSGSIWRGEFINKRKNGEEFWESASISPIMDVNGDITHFVAVKQDITERKQLEKEILLAKEKAEEATEAKSDFLANMSHEIRTPMNAVIGMTHLALKTELTPKQRDYLGKIQSSANSLLGIINDILDFSKIEAGKLDMESTDFNLDDVLDNLADLVTVKAREKEALEVLFAVDPKVPRFLVGDPLRLGQILINLTNNAVKFTESGEIVVSAELLKRHEDRVELKFSVSDTGIGLTEAQMDKLFQAFTQADTSTTRKFGGTGLGLTICKRVVEMMHGKIWVESQPGQGSTFSFTAEFGLGKERVKKRLTPSPDLRGLKVLVIDDNATSRNILEDILEAFSFEVSLAASGQDGLEEIERADAEKAFELVILDWKMPQMDGIETAKRIKRHANLKRIPPIILVTAYAREEVMQQAEDIGLEAFLLKPVSPSVLFDAVMQALGRDVQTSSRVEAKEEQHIEDLERIHGARVLLVEDNEINQQVAMEMLQGAGLHITVANNGLEAVDAVKKNTYDAVLMDIQMPVMNGYTAAQEIRKWETEIRGQRSEDSLQSKIENRKSKIISVPIIAMTAHAMAGDAQKSRDAGMNDHITKPIDPDRLFDTLQKWIPPKEKRFTPDLMNKRDALPPAETPAGELPDSLPGFDIAAGLKRLRGNKALYRKLLIDFGTQYSGIAAEIHVALEANDAPHARSLVHNLKGLAGNLEATRLYAASVEMEKQIKGKPVANPSDPELRRKFALLEELLNQALEAVQSLRPPLDMDDVRSSRDESATLPPDLAKKTVRELRSAVELGDVTQVKAIAEALKSETGDASSMCNRLTQLADDFDLDGILKLAQELDKHTA